MTEEQRELPPYKIAFIIDNKVVDILHTSDRLAAIFLSEPTIVDVTGENGTVLCEVQDDYDPETGTFTTPTAE